MSARACRMQRAWPARLPRWAWLAVAAMAIPAAAWAQAEPGPVPALPTAAEAAPAPEAAPPVAAETAPPAPTEAARAAPYERDVVEVTPASGVELSRVWVDNRLGSVRIEGHDRPTVVISAFKHAPDTDTLDRLKVTLISDPSGPVRISTGINPGRDPRPIPTGTAVIDLVIRAPRSAAVEARVWNGHLVLAGMENGADLHANHGDIEVKNASGHIVTHSAAGRQQFAEVVGAVHAQTLAGEMDLAMVRGERLEASAHQGSIMGRQVQVRYMWLRTTRGDIRLHGHAMVGGNYRVGSYDGDIEVQLASSGPLRVEAQADGGTVALSPADLRGRGAGEGMVTGTWTRGRGVPALVELRSRLGNIRFSLAE